MDSIADARDTIISALRALMLDDLAHGLDALASERLSAEQRADLQAHMAEEIPQQLERFARVVEAMDALESDHNANKLLNITDSI